MLFCSTIICVNQLFIKTAATVAIESHTQTTCLRSLVNTFDPDIKKHSLSDIRSRFPKQLPKILKRKNSDREFL